MDPFYKELDEMVRHIEEAVAYIKLIKGDTIEGASSDLLKIKTNDTHDAIDKLHSKLIKLRRQVWLDGKKNIELV